VPPHAVQAPTDPGCALPEENVPELTNSQLATGLILKLAKEEASAAKNLICNLLASSILLAEDWDVLPPAAQEDILGRMGTEQILAGLVEHGLLTEYQAARVEAGTTFGLILGNYRVLQRLGAGGMGVVFKGEHLDMRRLVAIKVFQISPDQDPRLVSRFLVEVRAVAQLNHPNIVAAIDAGKASDSKPGSPLLRYFAMEYVAGQDLEEFVKARGPLEPAKACDLAHQIACALAEVDRYQLVHRDRRCQSVPARERSSLSSLRKKEKWQSTRSGSHLVQMRGDVRDWRIKDCGIASPRRRSEGGPRVLCGSWQSGSLAVTSVSSWLDCSHAAIDY
jgi:hypothetical protein